MPGPLIVHGGSGELITAPGTGHVLAGRSELPTGPGYAFNCLFVKTGDGLYINYGTLESANFVSALPASLVIIPVDSATEIEVGDLLYLDVDDVKPASSQVDQGTMGANQQMFHDNFAGVAMQASDSGESDPIRVATIGVFEFDITSTTLEVGDLIGAEENGAGNALLNQKVRKVTNANAAVGRCVKRLNPAGTSVLVDIVSSTMKGGTQTIL